VTRPAVRTALGCLALAATACGEPARQVQQPPADTAAAAAVARDSSLAAALRRPWTGDLDSMRGRRMIRVLVPLSPTFFFYDGLRERGTVAESFREFEAWLNRRDRTERTPTAVVFLPDSRDRLLSDLMAGRGDVVAGGLAVTARRARVVAFTRPVAEGVAQIVVTGPGAPPLARVEDLSGKEVYVRGSSAYAEAVVDLNRRLAASGRPPVRIREANPDLEDEDILEMVNAGVVPITVASAYQARFWSSVLDSLTPRPDLELAGGLEIAYAVRPSSPRLRAVLDDFIAGHRTGTAFGNTVMRRYLVTNRWVRGTNASDERRRVAATIRYFRRYAGQYDLDYLLLMAQGYQESQLRQELRSPVGAIGVMQLMPATAAGPPISIPNVSTIDNNIRAGAKYMRFVEDRYFADSALTRFNRQVFALAAYNAGPNRINTLRRMARAEGLDGDVWFRNVELIAGREIGRETTTYVRNILKYYATYQLTLDTTRTP